MDIKITFDATPAFLEVFQGLIKALNAQPAVNGSGKKQPAAAPAAELKETTTQTGETQMVVTAADEKAKLTQEQVRAVVQRQSKAGKRDEVKKLLGEFGADKLPDLKESQYADFLTKLEAL